MSEINREKPFLFVWIFDERFALPAYLSLQSLSRCQTEVDLIQILIIVPDSISSEILSCFRASIFKTDIRYFSSFGISHHNPEIANRLLKIEAVRLFSNEFFVFLVDSDIIFTAKFSESFRSIQNQLDFSNPFFCGVVEYLRAIDAHLYFAKRNAPKFKDEKVILSLFRENFGEENLRFINTPQYNTGFVGFSKFQKTAYKWSTFYESGFNNDLVNLEDDQIPLSASLYSDKINSFNLPDSFNSRGLLNGNYSVFHAWNGKWLKELIVNLEQQIAFSDFGREYLFHLKSAPSFLIDNFKEHFNIEERRPKHYKKINCDFSLELQFTQILHALSNNKKVKQLRVLEIGCSSQGKSTAYLFELCKRYFSDFVIHSIVNPIDYLSAVKTNLKSLEMIQEIKFCSSLHEFSDESLEFIFLESVDLFQNSNNALIALMPKLSIDGTLIVKNSIGNNAHLLSAQDYCIQKNINFNEGSNCFFIKKVLKS